MEPKYDLVDLVVATNAPMGELDRWVQQLGSGMATANVIPGSWDGTCCRIRVFGYAGLIRQAIEVSGAGTVIAVESAPGAAPESAWPGRNEGPVGRLRLHWLAAFARISHPAPRGLLGRRRLRRHLGDSRHRGYDPGFIVQPSVASGPLISRVSEVDLTSYSGLGFAPVRGARGEGLAIPADRASDTVCWLQQAPETDTAQAVVRCRTEIWAADVEPEDRALIITQHGLMIFITASLHLQLPTLDQVMQAGPLLSGWAPLVERPDQQRTSGRRFRLR